MLALVLHLNPLVFVGVVVVASIIGYAIRSRQLESYRKKIGQLENEMLSNHAEILQLHKEKIDLLKSISEPTIPVIPINSSKDDKVEKMPDGSLRKKLLVTPGPVIKQQTS